MAWVSSSEAAYGQQYISLEGVLELGNPRRILDDGYFIIFFFFFNINLMTLKGHLSNL